MKLTTERLIIRPWQLQDASDALAMYGDPRFSAIFKMPPVPDLETQTAQLASRIEADLSRPAGHGYFACEHRETGRVIGAMIIKFLPPPYESRVEIGWHLNPEVWGNGYATEAAKAGLDHMANALKLSEAWAIIRPENTASQAVARRLGMTITEEWFMHVEMRHDFWHRPLLVP